MFNITSKYFSFFNNKPPASWAAHIRRDFLTCCSCSWFFFMNSNRFFYYIISDLFSIFTLISVKKNLTALVDQYSTLIFTNISLLRYKHILLLRFSIQHCCLLLFWNKKVLVAINENIIKRLAITDNRLLSYSGFAKMKGVKSYRKKPELRQKQIRMS